MAGAGIFQSLLLYESQQTVKHTKNWRSWLFMDAKPCNLAGTYKQRCHIPNYTALHSLHIHRSEVLIPRISAVSGQADLASPTELQAFSDWQSSLYVCDIWCRLSGPGLITIVKLFCALDGRMKQHWSKWERDPLGNATNKEVALTNATTRRQNLWASLSAETKWWSSDAKVTSSEPKVWSSISDRYIPVLIFFLYQHWGSLFKCVT